MATDERLTGPDRVRKLQTVLQAKAKEEPGRRFHALSDKMWREDILREALAQVRRNGGSAGVDRESFADIEERGAEAWLGELARELKDGTYAPQAVRQVRIPKKQPGKFRPLGIACIRERVAQTAALLVLAPSIEADLQPEQHAYRPGRSANDAVSRVHSLLREGCKEVVDGDLSNYFDAIERGWLVRFLEHRIGDRRVIGLLESWLDAGVMQDGKWTDTGRGTPQGAHVSPVLANVFLHYVLDLWFQRRWRPNVPGGEAVIVRYADDFVVGFQSKEDAERFLEDLKERLAEFGLDVHPEKTRLVEFGRFAAANRERRGQGQPETFDFLGFTHYVTTTKSGRFRLGRKPIAKRMSRTLKRIREVLRKRWHHDRWEVGRWLGQVLNGWLNYYAVPGSSRWLRGFVRRLKRLWLAALRRRSQRDRFAWKKMERMTELLGPNVTIRHPWPDRRFAVKHPRQEPCALPGMHGFCTGGVG